MSSDTTKKSITEQTAAHAFMNQIGLNVSQGFQTMIERMKDKWKISSSHTFNLISAADHFLALEIVIGLAAVQNIFEPEQVHRLENIIHNLTQQRAQYLLSQNKDHENIYELVLEYQKNTKEFLNQQQTPIQEFCKIMVNKFNLQTHSSALEIQTYIYVHFTAIEVWKGMVALFDIQQDMS